MGKELRFPRLDRLQAAGTDLKKALWWHGVCVRSSIFV